MYKEKTVANADVQAVSSSTDKIGTVELLLVLLKHWKTVSVIPVAVAVATAIVTLFLPNVYTAKTMILPTEDNSSGIMGAMMSQVGTLAGLTGGLGGIGSRGELYVTMLKSEVLRDPIIDRFRLMERYGAKYRANAHAALSERSSVNVGKKDGVITVTVDDTDPKLASSLANAYVEELGAFAAKMNTSSAGMNRTFLEERLGQAKVELARAEEMLRSFQDRNKAVAVTDQAKATLEGIAQIRAQLVAQEVQLATLRQQFSPQSREVKGVNATINNLRAQIARLEGKGGESSMPGVGSIPELGQEYVRLMREFKVQETLVELLTKQYEMTKLTEAKDLAPFQVLQAASAPELKSKPRRSLIVIAAFLCGLLVSVIVALCREMDSLLNDESRKRWEELLAVLPPWLRRFRKTAQE